MSSKEALQQQDADMINALMNRGLKLPPQPRIVQELRACRLNPERDIRLVARIINQDAGIVAMLFKIVGSPVYRHHQPFTSVEKIVQTLGVDQVANIVQAIALITASSTHANLKVYERFWANSTAIAELAMMVADELVSVCNIFPNQAYLAGIFHDCGVPLLMERFPTYCQSTPLDQQPIWFQLAGEDCKFQTDHAVVGYFVAKHWKLPDFICDAIRFHHDLLQLDDHAARTMVAILEMATHLYSRSLYVDHPEWHQLSDAVLAELGMDDSAADEFIEEMLERYHGGKAALGQVY
ncbi:histidine kinase [Aquitalea magnusonii]|nr:histidine kinase [Aquitalea magnusonii]